MIVRMVDLGDLVYQEATESALLAIPAALVGGGTNDIKRLLISSLAASGTAYAAARYHGMTPNQALEQASIALAAHLVVSTAKHGDSSAALRRGQRAGKAVKTAVKSAVVKTTAAAVIGTANADFLPRQSVGGSPVIAHHDFAPGTRAAIGTSFRESSPTPDPVVRNNGAHENATPDPVVDSSAAHESAVPGNAAHDEAHDNAVPTHVDENAITERTHNPNTAEPAADNEANHGRLRREQVGDFTIVGTRQMDGTTMRREIPGMFRRGGAQVGIRPLLRAFEHLIADARAAGATRLQIGGRLIANPNVLRIDRLVRRYGGTVQRTGATEIEIDIPLGAQGETENTRPTLPTIEHAPTPEPAPQAEHAPATAQPPTAVQAPTTAHPQAPGGPLRRRMNQ